MGRRFTRGVMCRSTNRLSLIKSGLLAIITVSSIFAAASLRAHTSSGMDDREQLRQHILEEFMQKSGRTKKVKPVEAPITKTLKRPVTVAAFSGFDISSFLTVAATIPPVGNGALMQASFAPFMPKVRTYWDGTTFFIESDNTGGFNMPNKMVGITTWQQQVPIPTAYFASVTNNENNAASLGFGQPNYWRIPLAPTVAASPITIYDPPAAPTNFLRGAVALGANGIAIFNPSNNAGRTSYEIGELDYYGGHCGLADDYHYHIIPTHLYSRFGGPLGDDKPAAWALDGYPIYGFVEPDGSPRQALDAQGGHDHGGWGYHYHAIGTTATDATHPYGSPASPYMMRAFHGEVVNFGNQVDGQPEVSSLRSDNSGGYNAKAVAGASIVAMLNPVALTTDGNGNYIENTAPGAVASPDAFIMRVNFSGTILDECWTINRKVNPRTLTMTWRMPSTTMISVVSATQFKLSAPATGTGSGLTLTSGSITLTNCSTTAGSTTVNCDSTTGLAFGQVVTGTNIANQPVNTTIYAPTAGSANGARLTAYPMGAWSEAALPDTSQIVNTTATFGEDSDYTSTNQQSFTDNGNGTITDNVTGLMWQKTDAGEMTWENAVNNASAQTTGGYSDWRLPNPQELFSIMNHENNGLAINTTYFPQNGAGAEYWWTRDVFGSSTTNVWCVNAGGGLGPKPKSETISANGTFRYHARYVRLAQNNMTHNYVNNGDGTITDTDTSLMWTRLPSTAMAWDSALTYAETLATGGYSDWRMPNIKELQTLTDYALATVSGGTATNLKPAINRTMFAKTLKNCSFNTTSGLINCDDTTGLVVGMTVVDPFSVAGTYISNTTTPTITQVNSATSFTINANPTTAGSGLILRALPRATAYWSSTSNKGTTTEAWLLELGVNNSVPVAEGPPRGSQGIISYQAKTASFPIFAVRTAVLTTNITVTQNSTALTDGVSTVAYGNVNVGSSLSKTFTINNTGSSALNITGVTIDGTDSANFSVTTQPAASIAATGSTTFTVLFNALTAGSKSAVVHIASDDAGNPSFDINLSGVGFVPPPTISNISVNPISPSSSDPAVITAQVTPGGGASITGVTLTYDLGAQVTAPAFREIFGNTNTNGLTGSMNTWTTTTVRAAGDLRQRGSTSNHTVPIVLTNCTTNGTTSVTCTSTTGLIPGMLITGTNIAANTTISQVNSATAITLSQATSGSGTALTLTAAGVTLTSCVAGTVPTINTASTTGLAVGMGLSGSGLATTPNNPTVAAITNSTAFTTNSTAFGTIPATLTASGMALEFNNGTVNYTDTMAKTPTIPAANVSAGNVEFWARNADLSTGNGWTLQVSPTGADADFVTRMTESFASTQATCTLNNGNNQTSGSTTVLCSDTSKLVEGNTIQGTAITIANCITNTATPTVIQTANTTGLAIGMFITGANTAGIPNNSRITAISPGVSFTINNNVTVTNAAPGITLLANYLPANVTIGTITPNTSFTISSAAFYSGSATLSCVNHGYKLYHYDFVAGEMTANMKLRWQYSGNTANTPARAPSTNIDDIVVTLTTGAAPTMLTMYDDGLHSDGMANDGIYGATIPALANGSTVNYTIAATGSGGSGTTTSNALSYTVAPAPTITTLSPLPTGSTVAAYSQSFAATGGSGAGYTWYVFSGALPSGLTLNSSGLLSGTATSAGTFNFTVKVTDSLSRSATKSFALTITTTTAPNVVIIITDDQGWGDVGYHTPVGQVPIETPNMDSFGTTLPGSIRLERFYATTVCSVTRSTLATGRNPIRHATNNVRGTPLSEHMMPQSFKSAGYQTFMCGKWHLGGSDKNTNFFTVNGVKTRFIQEGLEYAPYNRGWDSHYGQYSGAIDYYTHRSAESDSLDIPDWWLNGVQQDGTSEHRITIGFSDGVAHVDASGTGGWSPDLLAEKAVSHIQTRDPSKPMLLHVAFNSIHGPISAPQNLITKYTNRGITNANRRLTAAAVDGMDQAMGRILKALDDAGIANNTVVVWFGDNGGDETKGSLNDPLRGDKGDSYEGGLHEVAGIRWPGVLATTGPIISNQYLWVGDLFPTLAAAVGVTPQNTKPMDGLNMWPALLAASPTTTVSRGAPLVTDQAAPIAIYQFTDPVNGGTKDFKLRRGRVNNVVTPELFNLTDDPYETTDLIANSAYVNIVNTLTSAITAITADNNPPYIGPPMITNTVGQGGTTTLYAPFTSYKAPTIQWRKGGSSAAVPGTAVSTFTQIVDSANAVVTGSYAATLTLTNVAPGDAGSYDVVITNVGGTTTSASGVLTVTFGAPVLTALPTYSQGTSCTISWPAVSGATSYTVQRAATADFATVLSSQTVNTPSATFTGLASGTLYYYRATATDGTTTSVFSNTVSSTQDASNPAVAITSPANAAVIGASPAAVAGTVSDALSGVAAVVVNGITATVTSGNWTASVPLVAGANILTATATDTVGNTNTASISVTLNAVSPLITNVSTGPSAPTYLDQTTVYVQVAPGAAALNSVQLLYDTGTPVSTKIWQEEFNITNSNNWNGTGALNAWTTVGGGVVRQAIGASNHTVPIGITNATTNGTTLVTCDSTANLWPGMRVTGLTIPAGATIAQINSATSFTLSTTPSSGSVLSLTASGMILTNCATTGPTPGPASATVTCDNTIGLVTGMGLTGSGVPNNATVSSFTTTSPIGFTMNNVATATGTGVTITASGAATEFNGGTANLTDSMFTTTNAINTTGTAGYVEFWVQTRDLAATNNCGWQLQISSDNGTTWHNAVDGSVNVGEDWNSETVNLTNVVTNTAGSAAGSTTVTCASTTGLTTGRSVVGPTVNVSGTTGIGASAAIITGTDTTNLRVGMFLVGSSGIPNNARILTIDSATQFTMTANSTLASATSITIAATYFAGNATVSAIWNGTTFTLNTAAYVNTTTAPITAGATTINHGYQLFHHDLDATERVAQMKMRFQAAGYSPAAPTRSPRISIDDIVIATTAPPPTVTLVMFDDGNHGDGAAGDGLYAAQIPAQTGDTTVNFRVRATDAAANVTTNPVSGNFTYTVKSSLTDATIANGVITGGPVVGAEFLTLPKSDGVTVNAIFSVNQNAFIEYGTQPGKYTYATTPTLFSIDNTKPEFLNPVRIAITGLQPDTEYYYRLRHKNTGDAFYSARGERSFHTARPRGTTFKFTITADPHLDVNTDQTLLWQAMQNIATDNPDIHIDLGDIFMTDKMDDSVTTGLPAIWGGGVTPGTLNQTMVNNRAMLFRNQFERCCHSIPFFFTLGNHEAEYGHLFNAAADKQNNIPAWDLKARKAYYPAPEPDSFFSGNPTPMNYTGGTLGLLQDYYAWEWGDALFIVLDPFWNTTTNPNSANTTPAGDAAWNWSLGKPQYDWLKTTLKNSSAKYKFIFMHHIVGGSTTLADNVTKNIAARGGVEVAGKYEWGGKNTDGTDGFATKRPGWDMPIHNLFVQNKVAMVFHGHDHLYGLQTLDGVAYLECPQPGTANYTSLGSAGDGKYTQGLNSLLLPNSGHIRMTVTPDQVIGDFVRAYRPQDENASRHNLDVTNSFTVRPAVFPPIEMVTVSPGQVSLRWNAVVNKPYQIQWSTDLINWQNILTTPLTFTNTNTNATYTDTLPARVNGQRAFYRVSYTP